MFVCVLSSLGVYSLGYQHFSMVLSVVQACDFDCDRLNSYGSGCN